MILFYFTVGVSRVVLVGVCCYHGDSQSCGILKAPICLTLEEQYESIIIFIRADLLASLASAAARPFIRLCEQSHTGQLSVQRAAQCETAHIGE